MTTLEEAREISIKYLEKRGIPSCEIIDIKDKIFKWRIEAKKSTAQYVIEISKSDGLVLKFEVI